MGLVKVAIIMSVYKSDNPLYFRQAVESVLNQTEACDLYLYRDGGVPTDLQNAIDEYVGQSKVEYYAAEKNNGLAYSLNYLVEKVLARGYGYIARMDSDDISYLTRLEKQLYFFRKHPDIDVCGTFCREFGSSYALDRKALPTTHEDLLSFSVTRCPFIHPSVMFRSRVFSSGYRYPVDTELTEDMALWFSLLKARFKFGNVNEVLIDYRLTEDTVGRRKGVSKAWSEFKIRFKHMIILEQVSFVNLTLVVSRLVFHLLPARLLKLAYRYFR